MNVELHLSRLVGCRDWKFSLNVDATDGIGKLLHFDVRRRLLSGGLAVLVTVST